MSAYNKNNKFVSYLIILIALFILILVTKWEVISMQENSDLKETYNSQLNVKKEKLTELNNLKNELISSSENISKYTIDIKEDELIDYIYSYIEKSNDKEWVTMVKSLTLSEAEDTEIGFKETTVTLTLSVANELKLKDILDFLTSSKSKYKFFISSFNFPYGDLEWNFNVTIPLKILHK